MGGAEKLYDHMMIVILYLLYVYARQEVQVAATCHSE